MGAQRDKVVPALRSLIVTGELEPGRIFSENELATRFKVSRTPVREAIAILAREGLLDQIPQVGVTVHIFSEPEIEELLKTRLMMETHITGELAARPPTEDDIAALRKLTETMEQAAAAGDRSEFLRCDALFHLEIARRATFLLAAEMLERISDKVRIVGLSALFRKDGMDDVLAEHRAILDGLAGHDSEAASKAMEAHLVKTRERLEQSRLQENQEKGGG